jgi:hypothetical protein
MNLDKDKIIAEVELRLKSRLEFLGLEPGSKKANVEEASFLAGAMSAMSAMCAIAPKKEGERDVISDLVPPIWFYMPMSGRSVIVERERFAKEKVKP